MRTHGSRPTALVASLLAVMFAGALSLAACGGSGTTASSPPSASPSVAVASQSPSATPLPTPTVAGTIAFSRANTDATRGDIYLVHADGTGLTRLASGSGPVNGHPSWSPDGTRIVYHSGSGSSLEYRTYTIWVMSADGSHSRRLTRGSVRGLMPSWSPDGKHIAFSRAQNGSLDLAVMDADGSHLRALTSGGHEDAFAAWASKGRVLFVRNNDVFAVNLDGGGVVRVTKLGGVGDFALSPDGTSIVIDDAENQRILLGPVRGSGTSVTLLDQADPSVDIPGPRVSAGWTRDGKAVALANSAWAATVGSPLYIVNADGSGLSLVPNTGEVYDPAWRPQ